MQPSGAAPALSVILPVRNGAGYLDRCLQALRAGTFQDFELIVIDDGSTDDTAALLRQYAPEVLITLPTSQGPFACRNLGAARAHGQVLLFIDADVVVGPDTLARCARHFQDPVAQCLIGLYSLSHPNENLASVYKNAWVRFTYLRAPKQASWFFTAIGAVRKTLWDRAGGFRPNYSVRFGGGDVEFGQRLVRAGVSIHLDKDLEVVHLKRYALRELLSNDLRRAYGWSRLALRAGRPTHRLAMEGLANVNGGFVLSIVLSYLLLGFTPLIAWHVGALPILPLLLGGYGFNNLPFYRYLAANLSLGAAVGMAPLMLLDHLCAGLGVLFALTTHFTARRPDGGTRP